MRSKRGLRIAHVGIIVFNRQIEELTKVQGENVQKGRKRSSIK
jgi:hypothetical protein